MIKLLTKKDFDNFILKRIGYYKEEIVFYDDGDYDCEEEYDYLAEQHAIRTYYYRSFLNNSEKYLQGEMTRKEFCKIMNIDIIDNKIVENIKDWSLEHVSYDDYNEYIYDYEYPDFDD